MSRRSWSVRRAVGLVAVLSCLLLAQVAPSAGGDRSVAVGQGGDRFTPARVEIVAGDTVVWTNHGGWHNVHGDGFSNAVSDTSWTFRHTFTGPGTFDYVCDVHPNMRGTVVVSAAPAPPPAETEPAPAATSPAPAPAPVASPEPADGGPTTSEPRPQPAEPADPEPTSEATEVPSERPSPSPVAAPTTEPAGTAPAEASSPDPTPTATVAPSATPGIAAPASDAGSGGRGGAVVAAVAAALLLATGGVWVSQSRRQDHPRTSR